MQLTLTSTFDEKRNEWVHEIVPGEDLVAVYNTCPVCNAQPGDLCSSEVGMPIGNNAQGAYPTMGVHLGRLRHIPKRVKIVDG